MVTIKDIKIVSENSSQSKDFIFNVTGCNFGKIQVSGNGLCNIQIEGRITSDDAFNEIVLIDDKNFNLISQIVEVGIYTFDCEGYESVKIKINSIVNTLKVIAEGVKSNV